MKQYYLVRLDDACPQMNRLRWQRIENILDKYDVIITNPPIKADGRYNSS